MQHLEPKPDEPAEWTERKAAIQKRCETEVFDAKAQAELAIILRRGFMRVRAEEQRQAS